MEFNLTKNIPIEVKDNFYVNCIINCKGNTDISEQNEIFQKIEQLDGDNILNQETIDWFYNNQHHKGLIQAVIAGNQNSLIIPPHDVNITDKPLILNLEKYHFSNKIEDITKENSLTDYFNYRCSSYGKTTPINILNKIADIKSYPNDSFLIKKYVEEIYDNDEVEVYDDLYYYQRIDGTKLPYYYYVESLPQAMTYSTSQRLEKLQNKYSDNDAIHVCSAEEILKKYIQETYGEELYEEGYKEDDFDINLRSISGKKGMYELCVVSINEPIYITITTYSNEFDTVINRYLDNFEEKMKKTKSLKI